MMKRVPLLVAPVLLAVFLAPAALSTGAGRAPAIRYLDDRFGPIPATPGRQALYYWSVEKRAGGKVRCTGACAQAWPPLLVRSRAAVRARVRGIRGRFGVTRRPDGRLQVTFSGLPVYTYANERPT